MDDELFEIDINTLGSERIIDLNLSTYADIVRAIKNNIITNLGELITAMHHAETCISVEDQINLIGQFRVKLQ